MKFRLTVLTCVGLIALISTAVLASPIRVVTYNILADTSGHTTAGPGFMTVMQGIGDEIVVGVAQPLDIIALQETTSNTTTVAPIVTSMNSLYGAGTYAMSPYQATQNGSPTSGNGPNALIYKTTTLQLIASVGIGTPSSSGAPRQPVRYQFRPVGGSASNDFYLYNSHYKSGTGSTNKNRRNAEAQMIRSDAATLPAGVRIIYTGDFNWNDSTEPSYVTLTATGQGQGFDPINRPGIWALNSDFQGILTMSAGNLRYRDDCQLVTANVMNDSSGLRYISGSYHTFGVDGSTPVYGTVDSPSNTALPGLPNRAAVLTALTTASDHIPMVADYETNVSSGQTPAITGQPGNQTACSGGTASFTITATGSPAPTYQWRKGATNLTNGGHISGAATATLTVNPVGTSDAAADYNCVATNGSGSATSNNAVLTVNTAPAVTAQPQYQPLIVGSPAAFNVVASGSPPPGYQWRKNASPLSNGGNISGATAATLTINPVGLGDAGNYDVVMTNQCGTATSSSAPFWRKGDMNCDGQVNGADITGFVLALLNPSAYAAAYPSCYTLNADMNGDLSPNNADVQAFVNGLLAP